MEHKYKPTIYIYGIEVKLNYAKNIFLKKF